jgi:Cdc6-like AAA superfamily ATPase
MTTQEKLWDAWRRQSTASTSALPAPDITTMSQVYAPRHLQRQFQELYTLLHPCLVVRNHNPQRQPTAAVGQGPSTPTTTNRSAFLQGSRGSGKSLVLQRCLQAFEDELNVKRQQQQNQQDEVARVPGCLPNPPWAQTQPPSSSSSSPFFRIVRIHGILVPGSKVEVVVQEILQQLTRSAYQHQNQLVHHQQRHSGKNGMAIDVNNNNNNNNNNDAAQISSRSNTGGGGGDDQNKNNTKTNKNKRQKRSTGMRPSKQEDSSDDDDDDDIDTRTTQAQLTLDRKEQSMEHLLRLRRTSFTNHFQLLNEILQYACLDRIPILFILDELDTFVSGGSSKSSSGSSGGGSNKNDGVGANGTDNNNVLTVVNKERQVLLYYLLDRVATQGSFLSLVGLSCHLRTAELLEKRVLSRAMGTARFIGFGPPRDFTQLTEIILDKFQVSNHDNHGHLHHQQQQANKFRSTLQSQVALLLSEPPLHDDDELADPTKSGSSSVTNPFIDDRQQRRRLYETLERSFRLGKDLRWFSRVFTLALSLYRLDCRNAIATSSDSATNATRDNENDGTGKDNKNSSIMELPSFQPHYLLEALVDMGASFLTPSGEPDLFAVHSQDGMHRPVSTNGRNASTIPDDSNGSSILAEQRMQALNDLCGPQIVLVLAAKRILTRDVQCSTTAALPPPLTFQRLWQEYNITYRGNTSRYGRSLVYKAFQDLLAMGLLRPAMDHSGTVPFQYDYHGEFSSLPPSSLILLPLHFNIDIYREMQKAMDGNLLDCPAALREWGKKTH